MAARAASHLQKEAQTNHLHWPNCKCKVCQININTSDVDLDGGLDGGLDICWTNSLRTPLPHWHWPRWRIRHPLNQLIRDTPTPLAWTWTEYQMPIGLKHIQHLNLLASHSYSSNVRMSPFQTAPFMLRMMEPLLSSKNSTWTGVPHSWCQIHLPYLPPLQSEPQPRSH